MAMNWGNPVVKRKWYTARWNKQQIKRRKTRKKLKNGEKIYLLYLLEEGKTLEEMSDIIGLPVSHIYPYYQKENQRRKKRIPDKYIAKYREKDMTIEKVASFFHVSESCVLHHLRKGRTGFNRGQRRSAITYIYIRTADKQKIRELRKNGFSLLRVGMLLQIRRRNLAKFMEKHGLILST